MPILFSIKGWKGNTKKQDRIERIYRISSPVQELQVTPGEAIAEIRELKITEQTSFDLDKVSADRISH